MISGRDAGQKNIYQALLWISAANQTLEIWQHLGWTVLGCRSARWQRSLVKLRLKITRNGFDNAITVYTFEVQCQNNVI